MTRGPYPPRLARRLLARALPLDVREPIVDDLDELFAREVETHGLITARVAYWRKVASFSTRFAAERFRDRRSQRRPEAQPSPGKAWLTRIGPSWMDVKLAVRMLIKYPGLTLVSMLGIAVAIAIGATTFSFSYGYLFPSLPLDEGDRVVGIENWDTAWNNQEHRSLHDFVAWRDELTSLVDLGAFQTVRRNLIIPGVATEQVAVAEMTASGFALARVPVLIGRPLLRIDEQKGGPAIVVIGYDVWKSRFASDPAIVGRRIRLGSVEHQVVGVMPEGFAFPLNHSFWVPLRADPSDYERRQGPGIFIFGRLAPGVTVDQAQAELAAIGLRAAEVFPETNTRLRPRIVRYANFWADDVTLGQVNSVLFLVSLLLVVVGVNVAILVYARTATRHGEIVVRTALGASRRRIVTQLFVEALVLAVIAASAGLLLASRSLGVLDSFLAGLASAGEFSGVPFWVDHRLSPGTMLYAGGLAIVAAAIAGVVPALKATGSHLQSSLREPGGGASMRLGRTWTSLIVAQVAFAVAILPGGVLYASQSITRMTWGPGFAAESFLTTRLLMDYDVAPSARAAVASRAFDERYAARLAELIERTSREPGVSGATVASTKPGVESVRSIELDDAAEGRSATRRQTRSLYVDAGFFTTFDVPIVAGRLFRAEEFTNAPIAVRRDADGDGVPDSAPAGATAVIVNRAFVQQIPGNQSALGRRFRYSGDAGEGGSAPAGSGRWYDIVGVVPELPANPILPGETDARVYHALAPGRTYPMTLHVRLGSGDPAAFGARLREIATALDPALRLDAILPLTEVYRREQLGLHMGALALGLVGLSVVLLSAAGIYALMSFTVTLRRREIGIRAALGAHPRRLLASIFTRAAVQLSAGVVVGVVAGALLDQLAGGEILGGRAAVLLPIVSALMVGVGLVASIGPARRGLRIQPTEALREQ